MASKTQTFEACMQRLDEIVTRMESGETTLEESLKLFEEGAKLSAACHKLLDSAEQRVMKLTRDASGMPVEQELKDDESTT